MIAAFELLKEKMLSRTTAFSKHTSLGISLAEKLNSSFFFPHKHYFGLKLEKMMKIDEDDLVRPNLYMLLLLLL